MGIFPTSLPQLDVFALCAPNCGCQLLRDFQAALRGEKYHEALDAAERAIALTGGRDPLGLRNRESAGSCRL